MKPIPQNILAGFNDLLKQRNVPPLLLAGYRKWLLYFLDFRAKYPLPEPPSDQVRLFAEKLRSKKQTAGQVAEPAGFLTIACPIPACYLASPPSPTPSPSPNPSHRGRGSEERGGATTADFSH